MSKWKKGLSVILTAAASSAAIYAVRKKYKTVKKNMPADQIDVQVHKQGLYEKYGLKTLIDAFMSIDIKDVTLSLFGNGPLVPYIIECCKKDNRIHYYGVLPNEKIVEEEMKATILVNPRPINEEFTLYSFPSKNMEYMVSGTPVLTTKLPGMPTEYYKYVYLFQDTSINGFKHDLVRVLSIPEEELKNKGILAKEFVLSNKNNIVQARRIKNLIFD